MEVNEEPEKSKENKNTKIEPSFKEKSLKSSNDNNATNTKDKNINQPNQFNKLELDKQHFQIIQQKTAEQESSEDTNEIKERTSQHKALSDKNLINFKKKDNNDNIQMQFKEIKETVKKSRSQDIKETIYNSYRYNDNNQTVFSLLNSYYKDIDLNLKEKNKNVKNNIMNYETNKIINEKSNNNYNINNYDKGENEGPESFKDKDNKDVNSNHFDKKDKIKELNQYDKNYNNEKGQNDLKFQEKELKNHNINRLDAFKKIINNIFLASLPFICIFIYFNRSSKKS